MLIEAPQNEARAKEVIAEAHRLISGKPIRLCRERRTRISIARRACARPVADGATIITRRSNVPFLQDALNRPRTLRPDTLSRAPKPIAFLPVDDKFELKGGGREIQFFS